MMGVKNYNETRMNLLFSVRNRGRNFEVSLSSCRPCDALRFQMITPCGLERWSALLMADHRK
jgi:hypothetical protein